MSSEGVVKIKGDTSDLDNKVDKSTGKMRQLGEHTQRAARHAQSFGDAWEHANSRMTRTLAHGLAITHVAEKAVEALKEMQDEAAKAATSLGGNALTRDSAAARMGISSSLAEGIVGGEGAATAKERTSFFASLADAKFGRGQQKLTTAQVIQLQKARNSGLYSDDELHDMVRRGDLSGINVEERFRGLGEEARNEVITRGVEYEEGEAKEYAENRGRGRGWAVRRAEARLEASRARHPGLEGFNTMIRGIPLLGGFYGGVNDLSGRAFQSDYHMGTEKAIREQTEMLERDTNKPTLAPGTEGEH